MSTSDQNGEYQSDRSHSPAKSRSSTKSRRSTKSRSSKKSRRFLETVTINSSFTTLVAAMGHFKEVVNEIEERLMNNDVTIDRVNKKLDELLEVCSKWRK